MNWDQIKGNWKQVTGKVKQKWGKLTDDDLTVIAGKRDELVGKLQERYGIQKDKAEKELDEFTRLVQPAVIGFRVSVRINQRREHHARAKNHRTSQERQTPREVVDHSGR